MTILGRPRVLAGIALPLLMLVSTACGPPCGKAPFSRTLAKATGKMGPVREASIEVSYVPGDGASASQVSHRLAVSGAKAQTLQLDQTHPATSAQCEQAFGLSIAADGKGAAWSQDGGRSWRYAFFDAPSPLYCPHRAVVTSADAWALAPSTSGLALDALSASTDPAAARRHAGVFDHRFGSELEAAAQLACERIIDPPLHAALEGALDHATEWQAYGGGEHDPLPALLRCTTAASSNDTSLRAKVQGALGALTSTTNGRALLTSYARGCKPGTEKSPDEVLWCMASTALGAPP